MQFSELGIIGWTLRAKNEGLRDGRAPITACFEENGMCAVGTRLLHHGHLFRWASVVFVAGHRYKTIDHRAVGGALNFEKPLPAIIHESE